jgi:hypothetical protein
MTDHDPNFDRLAAEAILERIADGESTAADWAAFRAAANIEPSLWQELAEAQRTHTELCAQVQAAIAVADTIEAPMEEHLTESLTQRIRVVASWGGWAAAAAVLLAWAVGLTPGSGRIGGSNAGLVPTPPGTPDQALQTYLDIGQQAGLVVGELPTKVMIETVPSSSGQGYEVFYIRQIVERTVVPELFQTEGVDEQGRFRISPAQLAPGRPE